MHRESKNNLSMADTNQSLQRYLVSFYIKCYEKFILSFCCALIVQEMHWKSGWLWLWLYWFILVQRKRPETWRVGVFFHTKAKLDLLETLTKQYGEKRARAADCILARHFPVATGTQPQVSCLSHPGQMLLNVDCQWLVVRSLHILLLPALSIHLEILAHIWEIFLTSAFLGSDIVVENISATFSFKLCLINLEPVFKQCKQWMCSHFQKDPMSWLMHIIQLRLWWPS